MPNSVSRYTICMRIQDKSQVWLFTSSQPSSGVFGGWMAVSVSSVQHCDCDWPGGVTGTALVCGVAGFEIRKYHVALWQKPPFAFPKQEALHAGPRILTLPQTPTPTMTAHSAVSTETYREKVLRKFKQQPLVPVGATSPIRHISRVC
jgi:hypothetical protein